MLRVRVLLTVAAVSLAVALAGCSGISQYVPDWMTPKSSPPPPVVLNFESDPPGADVRTAQGQTCQTPCSLSVPPENQAVNFAKLGYLPQTVQVTIRIPEHGMFDSPAPEAQPNPVAVVLQAGAPAKRLPPKPKPRLHRPSTAAPANAAPPPSDSAFPPPPPPQR